MPIKMIDHKTISPFSMIPPIDVVHGPVEKIVDRKRTAPTASAKRENKVLDSELIGLDSRERATIEPQSHKVPAKNHTCEEEPFVKAKSRKHDWGLVHSRCPYPGSEGQEQ